MKITCLGCQRTEFQFEVLDVEVEQAGVIALTCPSCGKSTSIQKRPGGGIEIGVDKHLEKTRD